MPVKFSSVQFVLFLRIIEETEETLKIRPFKYSYLAYYAYKVYRNIFKKDLVYLYLCVASLIFLFDF